MDTSTRVNYVNYLLCEVLNQDISKASYQVILEGECVVRNALFSTSDVSFYSLTRIPFKEVRCWRFANSCEEETEVVGAPSVVQEVVWSDYFPGRTDEDSASYSVQSRGQVFVLL